MQQKTTNSISYLILGISLIFIFMSAQSCTDQGIYQLNAQYIYINDTDSVIQVIGTHPFVINPQEEYTIKDSSEGPEHSTPNDYYPPFWGVTVVVLNNTKCDTLQYGAAHGKGEGILGRDNYTSARLNDRYFKFTYHFTEKDFEDATLCE